MTCVMEPISAGPVETRPRLMELREELAACPSQITAERVDMLLAEDDALAMLEHGNSDSETGETDPIAGDGQVQDPEQSRNRRGVSTFANCACEGRASAQSSHATTAGGGVCASEQARH